MAKKIDRIQIQEPPMRELKKQKSSCVKRGCAGSCGCVVLLVLAGVVFLYTLARPRTKVLHTLPAHFPTSIDLYDTAAIETIQFSPHTKYSSLLNRLIAIPYSFRSAEHQTARIVPATDDITHDTIIIEWTELPAQPNFIAEYYETHLKKNNFTVTNIRDEGGLREFRFVHATEDIRGTLSVEDASETQGTDRVEITVTIPPSE